MRRETVVGIARITPSSLIVVGGCAHSRAAEALHAARGREKKWCRDKCGEAMRSLAV